MKNILFGIIVFLLSFSPIFSNPISDKDKDRELNLRGEGVRVEWGNRDVLDTFIGGVSDFFFTPEYRDDSVKNIFITIAFGIKNFFIAIAVIFLIIGVMKLLFSWGEEEEVKKWKRNIIWVSIGIFVMQIATSVWRLLYFVGDEQRIDGRLGWKFWTNIFEPIVNILLFLAGFGFLLMMIYAFYMMISAGGDEEKAKRGKNIVIYAIIGFLLIRLPKWFVTAIYGKPTDACTNERFISIGNCMMGEKRLEGAIAIFGNILTYINGFIMLICVVLVIYAGWLVLISAGEEEKLKKAKNIIIYIAIGLIILVAGHAIFRFFILRG